MALAIEGKRMRMVSDTKSKPLADLTDEETFETVFKRYYPLVSPACLSLYRAPRGGG